MAISISKYDIVLHEQQHERDEQRKIRTKAMLATAVIYAILFLLALFIFFPKQDPPLTSEFQGGGSDIILGNDASGMGETFELVAAGAPKAEITPPSQKIVTQPQPEPQTSTTSSEQFESSNDPDAVAINRKENPKPKPNQTVTTTTTTNKEEAKPEPKPRQSDKRFEFENTTGHGGTDGKNTSKGTGDKKGDQGSRDGSPDGGWTDGPGSGRGQGTGDGDGRGPGFSLSGRSAVSLPQPTGDDNQGGVVVVAVDVDQNGRVISARGGVRGSTTTNASLIAQAEAAAKKARFNADANSPEIQSGTIRYYFGLR